jgi:hypothetical protein
MKRSMPEDDLADSMTARGVYLGTIAGNFAEAFEGPRHDGQ